MQRRHCSMSGNGLSSRAGKRVEERQMQRGSKAALGKYVLLPLNLAAQRYIA